MESGWLAAQTPSAESPGNPQGSHRTVRMALLPNP